MQVHNICITGSITHKTDRNEKDTYNRLAWRQRKIKFFDNSIVLKRNNFQLCLTKNIRFVLLLPNLKERFKERLEIEFHRKISRITFKIGNIHHSTQINYNCRTLIQEFIPELKKKFEIEEVQVTQEQNAPVSTTLSNLLMVGNFTFLAINLKLLSKTVTIRLQVDKARTFTHATLIITRFYSETQRLLKLLRR